MKTLTAVELIKSKHKTNLVALLNDVILVLTELYPYDDKDKFKNRIYDYDIKEGKLTINHDELYFDIEGMDWIQWLKTNFKTSLESDKSIMIELA